MEYITVLLKEAINNLQVSPGKIYVDATLGGGGHSEEILKRLKGRGHLYAFDQDDYAINYAEKRLQKYHNYTLIKANFANFKNELSARNIQKIDGIIFDLGLSSFQIDDKTRGFSYLSANDLDMRMDRQNEISAKMVINEYSYEKLVSIFYTYGEEKNAKAIAREIIKKRPIVTANELVAITDKINYKTKGHSAKRIFQALRIEVNQELTVLKKALEECIDILNKQARICVITFHSLEDRIVKHFFKKEAEHNLPKNLPVLTLSDTRLTKITTKPITPSLAEIINNPRSKSAKLRVAEKN